MLRAIALVVLGTLCLTAYAGEPKLETPKDVAKALKKAIRKGDQGLLGAAINRARELKETHEPEQLEPIVEAAGAAVKVSDSTVHAVVLKLFDELRVPGSYKYFRALLDLPDRVTGTGTRNARARAIMVAARVGGQEALADVQKLLGHPDVKFARTAARALALYTELPEKKKSKLVGDLVKELAAVEEQLDARKKNVAARAKGLVAELNVTLAKLTGKEGASTAAEWRALLAGE